MLNCSTKASADSESKLWVPIHFKMILKLRPSYPVWNDPNLTMTAELEMELNHINTPHYNIQWSDALSQTTATHSAH